jgi:ketosteroid isomerase-like protein
VSNEVMGAHEVTRALIERFAAGDVEGALELYADDAVVSVEFTIPDPIVIDGKAAHVAMVEAAKAGPADYPSRMYDNIEIRDLVIYETTDPDVVIAEWTYLSHVGDATVANGNIIVVTCREGKVVRSRDYHNHATRAVADGTVPAFVDALQGMMRSVDRR